MIDDIQVCGATSPNGKKYVCVSREDAKAWLPLPRFTHGQKFSEDLAKQGVLIFDNEDAKIVIEKVKALRYFPQADIVEHAGWNGEIFASQDGTIYAATKNAVREVAFLTDQRKNMRAGSLRNWRRHVLGPLRGQPLAELCVMLAFVGPVLAILEDVANIAIEIVGPVGAGKSTLQQIASSVIGAPEGDSPYWISLDITLNALEDILTEHRDQLIVLDEANRFQGGQPAKVIAEAYKALAFKFAAGDPKRRYGEEKGPSVRAAMLISANRSIRELANAEAGDVAAGDRLMTIRVPTEWQYGVYETLPAGYESGAAFAEALKAAACDSHGVAMPHFLKKLVKTVSRDRKALVARLKRDRAKFVKRSGIDANRGSEYRVAKNFGTIYAAARLARKFGTLPKNFRCEKAALACLKLHFNERAAYRPFGERLAELASDPRVVPADRQIRKAEKAEALATVWSMQTHRELRIPSANIKLLFPDWNQLRRTEEVRKLLRMDGDHLTVNAKLFSSDKPKRHFCFHLPTDEVG